MAIIGGRMGALRLRREKPNPVAAHFVNQVTPGSCIQIASKGLWPGDRVRLQADSGLPFIGADGLPMCPLGMGIFPGTPLFRSPAWSDDASPFPPAPRTASPFPAYSVTSQRDLFVGVDKLGRVSFCITRSQAINGRTADRIPLVAVDYGEITITSIEDDWVVICEMSRYALNTDAKSIDTTALGATFGESVKSLVTGGGDFDFVLERRDRGGALDSMALLRLVLLLERGCAADAQFWLVQDRARDLATGLLEGDLYYEAQLLVVGSGIDVAADALAEGTARFVTNGEISLKVGPDDGLIGEITISGLEQPAIGVSSVYSAAHAGSIDGTTWEWAVSPADAVITVAEGSKAAITFPTPRVPYTLTVTATNSSSVDSPQTQVVTITPNYSAGLFSSASVLRPADAAPYSAGDVMGLAGGAVWELPLVSGPGAVGEIRTVQIRMSGTALPAGTAASAALAGFRVHLFSAAPGAAPDNAAFATAAAERLSYIGYVEVPPLELIGGNYLARSAPFAGLPFKLVTTSLWAEVEVSAGNAFTPVPAAAIDLVVRGVIFSVPV